MTAYDDVLARRVASGGPATLAGGSSYFAPRGKGGLDPALFVGERLKPEVRLLVLQTLHRFWERRYAAAPEWSRLWLAGSGVTSAWSASRESSGAPGDLDCLIGVGWESFAHWNPRLAGNPPAALAEHLNAELHEGLWPSTAATNINGTTYELTYYINPTGTDIRAINPYAAYDVTGDGWTVRPVEVPADFSEQYFTDQDRALARIDAQHATALAETFNRQREALLSLSEGTPYYRTAAAQLHHTVRTGAALFDAIHHGRRRAFSPEGRGYFDPANYRWQAGKGSGAINVLRQFAQLHRDAYRETAGCDDPQHLLLLAALANGGGR